MERKKLGFKYLPSPDQYLAPIANDHCILLTNDGSKLTEHIIQQFKAQDATVAVLNLPNINNPIAENGYTLIDSSPANILTVLDTVRQEQGAISSFMHIHPKFTFSGSNFAQHYATEKEIIKTVFLLAGQLQKELNTIGEKAYARFLTISQMDGFLGKGNTSNTSIFGGGLTGLVKCLNLEWSSVFCRAVDINPSVKTATAANYALQEFYDANRQIVEVAYDGKIRKTPTETTETIDASIPLDTKIHKNSVFLVSGGAKGVTATCVKAMAKAFQCKFILLGRSDINFELPTYAQADLNERTLKGEILAKLKKSGQKASLADVKKIYNNIISKKEVDATIREIESFGSQVIYLKGDVTKLSSFSTALQSATDKLGAITGIIHGAGRLADKYIQDKTPTDFDNVLAVKLDGLLTLIKAVNVQNLQHLVMFSSVAGYYGNVGQTDYAIANEILSKAAHLFRTNHPHTHISAINWGAWDSGMVSGELKAQFEAMGVKLVNSEGGAAMLLNEFNTRYENEPSAIIGGTLPAGVSYLGDLKTHRINRTLDTQNNPFLQDHVIQGNPVLPVVNAVGWMAQNCERLYPDYRVFGIKNTKLFKGLVFDTNDVKAYTLQLDELEKSEDEIHFNATVTSKGKKLPMIHYKATIILRNKKSIPNKPSFDFAIPDTVSLANGKELYTNGALFHGRSFQGIDQIIASSDKHMLLSCTAPQVSESIQGQFPVTSVNTFFADIQYQGMVVWVQENNDGAKSLPLQTDAVTIYEPVPFEKKMYVHISIQESSAFKMVADCTVFDETGKVFMTTNGAAVTVSKQLQWAN